MGINATLAGCAMSVMYTSTRTRLRSKAGLQAETGLGSLLQEYFCSIAETSSVSVATIFKPDLCVFE